MEVLVKRNGDMIQFVIQENDRLQLDFVDGAKLRDKRPIIISPKELFELLKDRIISINNESH